VLPSGFEAAPVRINTPQKSGFKLGGLELPHQLLVRINTPQKSGFKLASRIDLQRDVRINTPQKSGFKL